jgi:hypothetical protein
MISLVTQAVTATLPRTFRHLNLAVTLRYSCGNQCLVNWTLSPVKTLWSGRRFLQDLTTYGAQVLIGHFSFTCVCHRQYTLWVVIEGRIYLNFYSIWSPPHTCGSRVGSRVMAAQLLSKYERDYIVAGVNQDLREDGRSCRDYRSFSLQTGVVSNTSGSAKIQLVSPRTESASCLYCCAPGAHQCSGGGEG